jgi:hypothetical protein
LRPIATTIWAAAAASRQLKQPFPLELGLRLLRACRPIARARLAPKQKLVL